MARHIASRLMIEGTLETLTPLHVGGFGSSPDTDMLLARNGKHQLYVPGTSLAGVLRAWCEQAFDDELSKDKLSDKLWGYQSGDDGGASFITVSDIALPLNTVVEIRDGVGIDRTLGVAADGVKYDRAVIPRGAHLKIKLMIEITAEQNPEAKQATFGVDGNQTKAVIGHLLQALKSETLTFGAAHTRGLGRIKLLDASIKIKEQTLNDFDLILDAILDAIEVKTATNATRTIQQLIDSHPETKPRPRQQLRIDIKWKPRTPLMVKAGYDGIGVDMLPLTSAISDKELSLVLPGSSVKGSLRSHAERIIRTRLISTRQREAKFNNQIDICFDGGLINFLFGSRGKSATEKSYQPDESNQEKIAPGRGALSVADCYAAQPLDAVKWRELEIAGNDEDEDKSFSERTLWQKVKEVSGDGNPHTDTRDFHVEHHVAIDRWTGGAADGALYSALVPAAATVWQNLNLEIDFARLPCELRKPAFVLVLLVLRDLVENRIPLGFATTRGMGEIEIEGVEINLAQLANLGITDSFALHIIKQNGNAKLHFTSDISELNQAWQTYRTASQAKQTKGETR